MKLFFTASCYLLLLFLYSCSTSKNYSPGKKYAKSALQEDYALLKKILEQKHPSIYWYTPKDSIDYYYNFYFQQMNDSMTEQQFAWKILAPFVDKIHCGHTSVSLSKGYSKWVEGKRFPSFPLSFKVWNDTFAVIGNLNRKDSIFRRGTIVTSINGLTVPQLIDTMFGYLPQDGYANNINYIRMSANFPYYHRNIFGLSKEYRVNYKDSSGGMKEILLPVFSPPKDSTKKPEVVKKAPAPKKPVVPKYFSYRSLSIDSSGKFATMTLNTFSRGKLRRFFRKSFRELHEKNIQHLILDIRNNGGGRVNTSTLLTKYISRKPFKVADTLFAVSKSLGPYTKYIKGRFLNNLELFFICKKNPDGLYHMNRFEKKLFKPRKKGHYNGKVYVITSGPTFSASTLFANAIKRQEGILLVGEETGGGWHGNNGIMIPDIILPHTKTRVRLPLFRLVQYRHVPKNGMGISPDIFVGTSYDALLKGYDMKMKVVREMILSQFQQP